MSEDKKLDCAERGANYICCELKTEEAKEDKNIWLWVVLIVFLIVLVGLGIMFRDRLKDFLQKIKSKKKQKPDDGGFGGYNISSRGSPPGLPPRAIGPRAPMTRNARTIPSQNISAPSSDDTFKKLRDISQG